MNKRVVIIALIVLVALVSSTPVLAQEESSGLGDVDWGILGAAFAIAKEQFIGKHILVPIQNGLSSYKRKHFFPQR